MKKYILKRIVYMVVVFFLVSILMYFLYNLIPSDPARNQLESVKNTLRPEEYEQRYNELREQMGLNDPILVRYARWMGLAPEKQTGEFSGMLQGDFGYSSFFKQDVSQVITVLINIFVTILSLGITIPLGIYCAVHKRGLVDKAVQVFTIVGYSIPIYIVALLFIWLFAVVLRWFPVSGMETPGSNFTGLRAFLDTCYYLTLPVLVLTFASLGAMIDALSMDYIRTARAKGLREKVVIYSHAWRNALLPVITVIISWFLSIFSGSVIVETTFTLNGMGQLYYQALRNSDYELALACQMFYCVVSLVGALIMDLSYGLVDPRVRVDK